VATAAIASLPPTVAAAVNLTAVAQCAAVLLHDASQMPVVQQCAASYTPDQLTAIHNVAAGVFSFKCFGQLLKKACYSYVQSYVAPLHNIQF